MPEWLKQLTEVGGPRAKVCAYIFVIAMLTLVLVLDGLIFHVRGEWTAAVAVLLGAVALAGGKAVTQ